MERKRCLFRTRMIRIGFYVELESHRLCVASIKHGKKLPDALYLFRPRNEDVSPDIWNMISQARPSLSSKLPANLDKAFKAES